MRPVRQAISRHRSALLSMTILALGCPLDARAQPGPEPATRATGTAGRGGIEEVVVTAQRRAESAQKTALSIQVLGAQQIRQAGISQASDLSKVVPGLQVSSVGSTVQIYVRGVGDVTTNPLSDPAVAFDIDGVYIGRPSTISSNFYDLSRIELLKGPQGTLYGRNASGGAINLISTQPTFDKVNGYIEGAFGDYDLKQGDGAINIPFSSTLAARLAFQVVDRNGYLSDGTNDERHQEGRARILWHPNNDLTVHLNIDGGHEGGKGAGYVLLPQVDPNNAFLSINSPQSNHVITSYPFLPFPATVSAGVPHQDNGNENVSLQTDYDMGFATLTVIPAYRHSDENYTQWSGFFYGQRDSSNQESIEARLSHASAQLKWVGGFYFYNQDQQVDAAAATNTYAQNISLHYQTGDRSYAGFGEATYSVLPTFRLIGGLRYTHEAIDLNGATYNESPLAPHTLAETYGPGSSIASAVTWKAGAEYDITPRSLVFFTASTGFKAGGLNPEEAPNAYRPEKLYAYTLGSRNRFLNNRLQVNGELFYWDYHNKQEAAVGVTPAGNFTNTIRNAASATLKGGSLDVVARLTDADTLHLYGEYNDTQYNRFITDIPGFLFSPFGTGCSHTAVVLNPFPFPFEQLNCSGYALAHAPKWTGSASLDHAFDFANGSSLTLDINTQFSSRYYLAIDFTQVEHADAYAVANVSATYRVGPWSITGFLRNFTNAAVYTGGTQDPIAAPLLAATINPPRTYGARLRYEF